MIARNDHRLSGDHNTTLDQPGIVAQIQTTQLLADMTGGTMLLEYRAYRRRDSAGRGAGGRYLAGGEACPGKPRPPQVSQIIASMAIDMVPAATGRASLRAQLRS